MDATEAFLSSARKQFLYYKTLGDKAMDQLEPEQLFYSAGEDTNSIAVIVRHLHGNMLSRWTDFLTSDGEKNGERGMRSSTRQLRSAFNIRVRKSKKKAY